MWYDIAPLPVSGWRIGDGPEVQVAPRQEVVLEGEIDIHDADRLRALFDACTHGAPALIDMSAVTYLDSTVLNELARLRRRCEDVVLIVRSAQIERILEIVGFDSTFRIVKDRSALDGQAR
jgi:anti-anti-sigma factor